MAQNLVITGEPPVIPAAPEIFDWTGFYIGAFAGGAWGEFDGASSGLIDDDDLDDDDDPIEYGDFKIEDESWLAGGQVGLSLQRNNIVFGLVADGMATDLEASEYLEVESTEFPELEGSDVAASLEWLATFRGLLGVSPGNGRFLLYLTGGLAFADIEAAIGLEEGYTPTPPQQGLQANTVAGIDCDDDEYDACDADEASELGVALGLGAGAHLTQNLVLDMSYLYVHFDEVEFDFEFDSEIITTGGAEIDVSAHLGRLGLGFQF
jgi:outer membrane immunogenic protein